MELRKGVLDGAGDALGNAAAAKGWRLDYGRWLDTQKITEHPALLTILDGLLDELGLSATGGLHKGSRGLSHAGRKAGPPRPLSVPARHLSLYQRHARRILLDLLEAAFMDREGWLRYQRNSNAYRPETLLHARGFTHAPVTNIVNAMKPGRLGWIEHALGYFPRDEAKDGERPAGKCSRMRATETLLQRFAGADPSWIKQEPLPAKARIVFKDKNKERIPPPNNAEVAALRTQVLEAEALFDPTQIELRLPPEEQAELRRVMRKTHVLLDLTGRSLFRVFNDNDITKGGRYYGPGYQGMPSKLRHWYYLNGEPTVELDFKCLHPSILYAEADEIIPDDCYHLDGYDREKFRPLIKRALNVFINAPTRPKAVSSLVERWRRERKKDSDIREEKCVWAMLPEVRNRAAAREVADSLLDALTHQHHAIAHKFGSDEGKRLQGVDASIAHSVLAEYASVRCPIMIFHDGFRVICSEAEQVWTIMRSEFRRRFHQDIRVEAKNPTPPLKSPEFSDLNVQLYERLLAMR